MRFFSTHGFVATVPIDADGIATIAFRANFRGTTAVFAQYLDAKGRLRGLAVAIVSVKGRFNWSFPSIEEPASDNNE